MEIRNGIELPYTIVMIFHENEENLHSIVWEVKLPSLS